MLTNIFADLERLCSTSYRAGVATNDGLPTVTSRELMAYQEQAMRDLKRKLTKLASVEEVRAQVMHMAKLWRNGTASERAIVDRLIASLAGELTLPVQTKVVDLEHEAFQAIMAAANRSPWINHKNYTLGDIVADICAFLDGSLDVKQIGHEEGIRKAAMLVASVAEHYPTRTHEDASHKALVSSVCHAIHKALTNHADRTGAPK